MIKKLSSNIIIYSLTNVIKSLIPFLMLPILTAHLTVEEYGTLSIIEISILFLTPFITININSAINVAYFNLSKEELKKYITNAIHLSLLSSIGFFILILLIAQWISSLLNLDINIIYWLPLFAFFRVISSVVLGLYQVSQESKKFAIYTLAQTIIDFTLSYILVVVFSYGYIGRLEGVYIAFFIVSAYGLYVLYKRGYYSFSFIWLYSKEILMYGIPLIPHVLGGIILAMSDRFFISHFIGNDAVGYYTVAYQIAALMLLVSISINQAWMPILFKLLENYHNNKKTIYNFTMYLFILYTLCGIFIYFLSDSLFRFLIDIHFYKAKNFFPILLLGFIFQSYYYLFTNFLFFQKKTILLAKLTFFSAILNLILNYLLITKYEAIGVAYATAIIYGIYFFIVCYVSIRSLNNEELS